MSTRLTRSAVRTEGIPGLRTPTAPSRGNTPAPRRTPADPTPEGDGPPVDDDDGPPAPPAPEDDPDDDPPGDNPDDSGNDEDPENPPGLAAALSSLARALGNRNTPADSRMKLRDPDPFDGSDPKKLNPFLLICRLNFRVKPQSFSNDYAKVSYALSYLKGTALDWFEPSLQAEDEEELPVWANDYDEFVRELKANFGPIDAAGDAEEDLGNLRMRDNQQIVKYNVEFNRLAALAGWGDKALRHHYYSGLPDRIKDALATAGQAKPATLALLRASAQQIDARYWERNREKSRAGHSQRPDKPKAPSNSTSNSTPKPAFSSNGSSSAQNSSKKPGSTSSNSGNRKPTSTSSGSSSTPKPSPLADKLGKDGRLTQEERQRRIDNDLCLFCGKSGHKASDCPKSTLSASKARAAKTSSSVSKETEPKK
jgi:hypothetical protein